MNESKISFLAAVLIAMNIMIGAGIYALPQTLSVMANSLGFLSWILAAIVLFPVIWGVAQASRIFPGEGGFYNYCTCGIGPTAGFFANWAYLLGYFGTAAALTGYVRLHISGQFGVIILEQYSVLFSFILILLITLLNLVSIHWISKIQGGATLLKLTPLFFVLLIFGFYMKPSMEFDYSYLVNIPMTLPLALFAFWGFESCCSIGHMIEGGSSQVAKVIFTAFFAVTAIYTLFHFGIIQIMGVQNLQTFGAAAFPKFLGFGDKAIYLISMGISCAILLSFTNSLYGVSLNNITNIFTLAEKRYFPFSDWLTKNNSCNRPYISVFLHGLILFVLIAFIPNVNIWAQLTGLGVMIALSLTQLSVFLYFLKNRKIGGIIMSSLGLISLSIAGALTWIVLGHDLYSRLYHASPMIVGFIVGFILLKTQCYKGKCYYE